MTRTYQIIVIGAGAGGLVVAIGAARAGKKVLLIEKGTWGGDCTNFGCIPSKALIASAEIAHTMRYGEEWGVEGSFSSASKALERVRKIVANVRSHEDAEALKRHNIETLTGTAHFVDPHTLKMDGKEVSGDHIVIATGSSPLVPDIEGLKGTPYCTNESIFDLESIPKSLTVIGGGPIGCELAQAFARLGSEVTLIHRRPYLLKKEEPEAQEVIAKQFQEEGIHLHLGAEPLKVVYHSQFLVTTENKEVTSDALLIALGRVPNVQQLNLEAANVTYSKQGIAVDKYGRTSQKHIYAVGDVTGGPQFTHMAENQGRAVLTSLLLPFNKKLSRQLVPRTTFTDPEVASFGLLQSQAEEKYGKENLATYTVPMTENDRAITASRTEGFVKVVTKKMSSEILGATIVGPRAGEMLPELSLAAKEKISLKRLSSLIHPYPTYNLAIRKAGDLWLTQTLLPRLRGFSWKRYLPLAIIVVLMIVAFASGVHKYLTFDVLRENHLAIQGFVSAHPVLTSILFILLYTVATSLSIPGGAILSLIGGYLFKVPVGTIFVLIGATLGASVIFLAAKSALGEMLRKKAGPVLKKMEKGFQENAWSYLLFLRFVPLFPFWLVNIAPAFFNVRYLTYAWTTFVGIIPGAYVFTQTGAGLGEIFETGQNFSLESVFNVQLRIALVALALFSLLPILIKKIAAKRRDKRHQR